MSTSPRRSPRLAATVKTTPTNAGVQKRKAATKKAKTVSTPEVKASPPKVRGLDLEDMSRNELQSKTLGVKGNKKSTELIKELKQMKEEGVLAKMNIAMRQSEGRDYWDDPKPRPLRKIVITPPTSPVKKRPNSPTKVK